MTKRVESSTDGAAGIQGGDVRRELARLSSDLGVCRPDLPAFFEKNLPVLSRVWGIDGASTPPEAQAIAKSALEDYLEQIQVSIFRQGRWSVERRKQFIASYRVGFNIVASRHFNSRILTARQVELKRMREREEAGEFPSSSGSAAELIGVDSRTFRRNMKLAGEAIETLLTNDVNSRNLLGVESLELPSTSAVVTTVELGTVVADGGEREQKALRNIADFDPFDLGVHHSIVIDDSSTGSALPLYAERLHDWRLRELLADVSQSVMVVLTGGSSTGKTRTAWEAVKASLPSWQFEVPRRPEDLNRIVEQPAERSQIVIWLDEAQEFLQVEPDEASRTLRGLLAGPHRVIVLATMWTDPYWQRFTTEPVRGEPDPWRQIRALLLDSRHVVRIRVPESFADEPNSLDALRDLAQTDGRLAEAVNMASEGKVIQTLAGGTLLVEKYRDAADTHRHAWAVITAAIDACRLGHDRRLPIDVLRCGALGYLAEEVDAVGEEDWFGAAIGCAAQKVRGVAILRPARAAKGIGPADSYVLDDYVFQHGQWERRYVPAPEDLWVALVDHVEDWKSRQRLVEAAEDRYMYRVAAELAIDGTESDPRLFYKVVQILEKAKLIDWLKASISDHFALDRIAIRERAIALEDAGKMNKADVYWRLAAAATDVTAMTVVAEKDEADGEIDSAAYHLLERARSLPVEGYSRARDRRASPYWDVVKMFCRAGRLEEAEEYWRIAVIIDDGMLDLLEPDGESKVDVEVPYEREWLFRAIADFDFPLYKIEWSFDDRAEGILRKLAEIDTAARPFVMESLADLLKRDGRQQDAMIWLERAAEAGCPGAMRRLAQHLEAGDEARKSEAGDWWRRAANAGDEEAVWCFIQRFESEGRRQEAAALWRWVLQGDDSDWRIDSIYRFIRRLDEADRHDEAESLARYVADARGPYAWVRLARYLMGERQDEEAEVLLRRATVLGERAAYEALCSLLRKRKPKESKRLARFGIEPDGKTAKAWKPPLA
ncbi:hypothetical protein AB0L41_25745 [Amycolatopsis mediterranei]|uniref:tetratricopeptide repeat protein n=1 Tax=Amycolatopsis mediterranei TaxID=33910 RepID=UPI003423B831